MLNAIVRSSLKFRGIIITVSCLFVGYGLYTLSKAKYDVFPEFAPPQVIIQTEAPGLSPEQVEILVTQSVENAINGVVGIDSLRSSSIQGLSIITVIFDSGSDIYRDRQLVAERLTSLANQLPSGIQSPVITPLTSSTSVVMAIGLTSPKKSLMELRTIADWTVKQRLLAVPGVAKVAVFGGEVKQFQIQVDPQKLIVYGISIEEVLDTARRLSGIRGAGFIDTDNQRIVLQTQGQSLTADQIANKILVRGNGDDMISVSLKDIAQVAEAPEPPIGASLIMGEPGIILVISSQYGANTLEVTKKVEQALEELKQSLNGQDVKVHNLFRPANFIETTIHNMRFSLMMGSVLVVLVLFLFLFNLRTAAISCAAIPLSLLAAVTILEHFGITLNTMTLGGLAIAIGALVDDAVITVENILRRLRENRKLPNSSPTFQVVLNASLEVRSAVVYATFAVVLVFIPVLTLTGVSGRLFAPLGIAYISATLASLLVALTVTPAMCLTFLNENNLSKPESPIAHRLKERYRLLLSRVRQYPKIIVRVVALLTVGAVGLLPFFGGQFLPELKEGHFIIHMSAMPGTSLKESLRIGQKVTQELLKLPYVQSVAQQVGRAEKSDDVFGTHYSEFQVDLKPMEGEEGEFAQSEIRNVFAKFPGINSSVKTFLTERVEETISGYTASIVINIFGNDLDLLDEKAQEITQVLGKIPGAVEVKVESPLGTPQLMIQLRDKDLMSWGFDPVDVLDVIQTAYQGHVVGQVYDGNKAFDVAVILDSTRREDISSVGELLLRNPTGSYVRLKQLADIKASSGRYAVLHQGARRVQTVTCNVQGDINAFIKKAKEEISSHIKFPQGTYIEFSGTALAQSQSKRDLFIHSLLAGVGIILFLSMVMGGGRNLILVLLNLPFAFVGGVLAVFLSGGFLSIGSLVGFVTLFGISVRNSIMMVSHYDHLVSAEGMTWGEEAALRGALERLVPILMTALVTALGLLPLAIGSGAPGREIEGPMAIVILGGLITSTALNLLVLPTLALRFGRFQKKDAV